jgi:hypothetical protein
LPSCDITIPATDTTSLISAIITGNSAGSPYRICLSNSTYTLTTSNNSGSDGANGVPVITSDITLHGLGAGATILRDSAAPAFRILKVDTGARLVLENLTISGGDAGSGNGGGIRNLGTLELRDSVVENNLPDDLSGDGAVIQSGD